MITIEEVNEKEFIGRNESKVMRFEAVQTIPKGYVVWNIGKNIQDGYLPLGRLIKGTYSLETNTLKIIKTPLAQTILDGVGYIGSDEKKMARYIQRRNDYTALKVKKSLEALKQFR